MRIKRLLMPAAMAIMLLAAACGAESTPVPPMATPTWTAEEQADADKYWEIRRSLTSIQKTQAEAMADNVIDLEEFSHLCFVMPQWLEIVAEARQWFREQEVSDAELEARLANWEPVLQRQASICRESGMGG